MPRTELMPLDLPFENHKIRIFMRNGDPWWAAADVFNAVGHSNSREALSSLDDDEKDVILADTLGGPQKLAVISEAGLYRVLFRSNKPEAKRFSKAAAKALVILRKHGMKAFVKYAKTIGQIEFYGEKSVPARNTVTTAMKNHNCKGIDYPLVTNAGYVALFGSTAQEIKNERGEPDCPVAKYLFDEEELVQVYLLDIWTSKAIVEQKADGGEACMQIMINTGRAIRQAKMMALAR